MLSNVVTCPAQSVTDSRHHTVELVVLRIPFSLNRAMAIFLVVDLGKDSTSRDDHPYPTTFQMQSRLHNIETTTAFYLFSHYSISSSVRSMSFDYKSYHKSLLEISTAVHANTIARLLERVCLPQPRLVLPRLNTLTDIELFIHQLNPDQSTTKVSAHLPAHHESSQQPWQQPSPLPHREQHHKPSPQPNNPTPAPKAAQKSKTRLQKRHPSHK